MNENILNTKWWVKINDQSELDRACFMCRVFQIPLFSDTVNDPTEDQFIRGVQGFYYDATRNKDLAGAMTSYASERDHSSRMCRIFKDLDSLYKFLESLRDDKDN